MLASFEAMKPLFCNCWNVVRLGDVFTMFDDCGNVGDEEAEEEDKEEEDSAFAAVTIFSTENDE